tara:strand:+ start:6471 stop:8102 length:1632 start_codon:yes stop_codon:yes gene_type:complete
MKSTYLKAHERFPYYFEPSATPQQQPSNKGATTEQQRSNTAAINQQQPSSDPCNVANWSDFTQLQPYTALKPSFGKNLVPQFELLKEYAKRYNTQVKKRRETLERELKQLREKGSVALDRITLLKNTLASDPYQQLRSGHHLLMKELIVIARDAVNYNNIYLSKEGLNKIELNQPFHIETSYPALMNRLLVASESTIYRQLKRLQIAGFLAPDPEGKDPNYGKVFHGTNAPLELLINPSILLIFDESNPDFQPEIQLPTETENSGPWAGFRAKCNHIISLKSIGNSLIEEMLNSEQVQNDQLTLAKPKDRTSKKRTPKKCAKSQFEGSASDPIVLNEIRRAVHGKRRTWRAGDFGGDFKKLIYARVYLLLQAALEQLWANQTIYTGVIRKTETYLIENYFNGVGNEAELDKRVSQILEIIQHNAKYIKANPGNRFAQLPLQYFNKKRQAKDKEDYSGFMGQVRLFKKRQEWTEFDQKKKEAFAKRNQLIQLKKYLRKVEKERLSLAKYQRCTGWVEQNTPLVSDYFHKWAAFNQALPANNSIQ